MVSLLVIAAAGTFFVLSRWLPLQNAVGIFVLTLFPAWFLEYFLSNKKQAPLTALLWFVALVNARGTAQWALRPWRGTWGYGFWLIGISGLLTVAFVSAAVFLMQAPDSSAMGFVIRFVAACVILILNATLFIRKNPAPRPLEKGHLALWIIINLFLIAAASVIY